MQSSLELDCPPANVMSRREGPLQYRVPTGACENHEGRVCKVRRGKGVPRPRVRNATEISPHMTFCQLLLRLHFRLTNPFTFRAVLPKVSRASTIGASDRGPPTIAQRVFEAVYYRAGRYPKQSMPLSESCRGEGGVPWIPCRRIFRRCGF